MEAKVPPGRGTQHAAAGQRGAGTRYPIDPTTPRVKRGEENNAAPAVSSGGRGSGDERRTEEERKKDSREGGGVVESDRSATGWWGQRSEPATARASASASKVRRTASRYRAGVAPTL
nr:unnamed protein product [Digitaria exilis]